MSQKDSSPSFAQQFILFFLLITTVQIGMAYFGVDRYFSNPSSAEHQQLSDLPPVIEKNDLYQSSSRKILISSDKMKMFFDEETGQLVELELNDYWTNMSKENHIATLFFERQDQQEKAQYIADEFLAFDEEKQSYEKATPLSTETRQIGDNAIVVSKSFKHFKADICHEIQNDYTVKKTITIEATNPVQIYSYSEIRNKNQALVKGTEQGFRMFQGASFHTDKTKYKKIPFAQFNKKNFQEEKPSSGWVAFSQRYFATALRSDDPVIFYSNYLPDQDLYVGGFVSKPIKLANNQKVELNSSMYSGPEDRALLGKFAPALEYVIDFGMLWPICDLLLSGLLFLHRFISDWGLCIIVLTCLIRAVSFAISLPQQESLKKMQQLQPKQEALRKKFINDDVAYNQAMWDLHKQEKINYISVIFATVINPLLQIPVLISFYSLLMESIILRQTTFLGWTGDLSLADPTYILPGLFLISSLLQQRFSPPVQNQDMALAMRLMPFVFAAVTVALPSGLLIYWICSNLIAALQAFYMTRVAKKA